MIDWILNNKDWFLSGIGVTILIFLMKFLSKIFGTNKNDVEDEKVSNVINQTVNVTPLTPSTESSKALAKARSKGAIHILFIDDKKVSFIPTMKRAGYSSVKYLKDCDNIHCQQIIDADIIFVDVNGVGINLFSTEQGFGLAKAIKRQFPNKCVVLYSAEPQYFRKDYNILDSVLPKNSEPYEFTKIIDDWNNGSV